MRKANKKIGLTQKYLFVFFRKLQNFTGGCGGDTLGERGCFFVCGNLRTFGNTLPRYLC